MSERRFEKSDCGVWMVRGTTNSIARHVAIQAMRALDMDVNDFRKRDAVIMEISGTIEEALDEAAQGDKEQIEELKRHVQQLERHRDTLLEQLADTKTGFVLP